MSGSLTFARRVATSPAMGFHVPETVERLCDGVRRFMDEHVYALENSARGRTLSRFYRQARLARISDGPDEVHERCTR